MRAEPAEHRIGRHRAGEREALDVVAAETGEALRHALVLHTLVYAAYLEDPLSWALLAIAAGLRAAPVDDEAAVEPAPALAAPQTPPW